MHTVDMDFSINSYFLLDSWNCNEIKHARCAHVCCKSRKAAQKRNNTGHVNYSGADNRQYLNTEHKLIKGNLCACRTRIRIV